MAVTETTSGKWQATFRGPDGRERQKTFTNRKAADRWERDGRTDAGRGVDSEPRGAQITMAEWSQTWMVAQAHLSPKTRERYAGIVRTHILPTWGRYRLARLTHAEIQGWVSELSATHAPASVHKTHRVLSLMLDLAVRDRRLITNPAKEINLPRVVPAKHRYLDHLQVAALMEGLDERDALIVGVLAYCGLRWGELAALGVASFDPLRRRLAVDRSVTEVSGHLVWGLPKDHERRVVPVPRFLIDRLADHCVGRAKDELLFANSLGTAIRVGNWRRDVFDRAVVAAGLPEGFYVHELRHTAASLAVSSGANVKAVQHMLGHARASMTLDTYADLFPEDLEQVAEAMDKARRKVLADFSRTSKSRVTALRQR